ncbi:MULTISPECIES: hypothetical protein [Pseudonocardia]|uniref:Uncharacterized protein n=2 Tax=Pseudonocardia TaxID=1847 RepID=A0A1Y2N5H3_PSEAH|nr:MULTISPECIES: hypothetical protein [Pseudonocardia]OSY42357.1 hypothetical protein BG845_01277 [Pseudonocardia autotrophica]TDN75877.1 hypothetical protein C8E95_5062 [Pseudonocardia autotrophica]BBF99848.1 hypothetical protein Pdca_10580 [Pseudonocardia autotrophica]GEC27565.1 hypothetical protein PSA01_45940 [Pseudonocardia saturnea]
MLKKAGIVVAAGAASLVALSPLAFASDSHEATDSFNKTKDSYNKSYSKTDVKDIDKTDVQFGHNGGNVADKSSSGLVNISGNNLNVSPQACGTALNGNSLIQGALGGLFSEAENSSSVNSDNGVNCTNASEVGDEFDQDNGGKQHGDKGDKGYK